MRTLGLILSTIFLWPAPAQSQGDLYFKYLTVEQGLPSNTASVINQDHQGFIWIGTWGEGVARYDGYDFKIFQNESEDLNSISHNSISAIYEDSDSNLWIGTWHGLNLYNRASEDFSRLLTLKGITGVFQDSKSRIWVGTTSGLNRWHNKDSTFSEYVNIPSDSSTLTGNEVVRLLQDQDQQLWIVCRNGLNLYNEQDNNITRYPAPDKVTYFTSAHIDRRGRFWIGTRNEGLWLFDAKTGNYTDQSPNIRIKGNYNELVDVIKDIYEDSKGNVWIVTDGSGIGVLDTNKKTLTVHSYDPFLNGALSDNNLLSIFEDRNGQIWIGSYNRGISIMDPSMNKFKRYYHHPAKRNGLSSNLISNVFQDEHGGLWISTDGGGLNYLHPNSKQVTVYGYDSLDVNSPLSDKLSAKIKDSEGWIWMGHFIGGLTKYHPGRNIFVRYRPGQPDSPILNSYTIGSAIEDQSGILWFATDQGLVSYNRLNNESIIYPGKPIRHILQDMNGKIWVDGLSSGLSYLDKNDHKLVSVYEGMVSSICQDNQGYIWLATLKDGLIKYHPESHAFTYFNKKAGFLADDCRGGLLKDQQGKLWVGSNEGIIRFDPLNETMVNFGLREGTIRHYIKPLLSTADGYLYFGGSKGIIAFHPDSLKDEQIPPTPLFVDFQLFNQDVPIGDHSVLKSSITDTKKIVLNHNQDIFSVSYASLSFDLPQTIQFSFKLMGYDEAWREVDKQRTATYTNLDAGSYQFQVKAGTQNDLWNEEFASLEIVILPPPWKTWWAYSLYGVLLFGLLLVARHQIIRSERLTNQAQMEHLELEKIKELDRLKSRFFANISHEFRTPLTLIQGPVKSLLNDSFKGNLNDAYQLILRNSERVLELINQLLDLAKLESGKLYLQASELDLIHFLKVVSSPYVSLAESQGITFNQYFPYKSLKVHFDEKMLEKIITNLFTNAFKFTPEGGEVSIVISKHGPGEINPEAFSEGFAKIGIKDTGPGIPQDQQDKIFDRFYQADNSETREQEGSGIGLSLAKELVELHHGIITVVSQMGKGSLFEVSLPLGKSHLMPSEFSTKGATSTLGSLNIDEEGILIDTYEDESIDDPRPLILIVEDNADLRGFLSNILMEGFQVETASNGQSGWELALQIIPDLVITDLMMPKMDGIALSRRLKNDEKTSHIPIIILTAKAESQDKLEGLQTGADSYLTKPFDGEELLVRVEQLIKQRQKLQQYYSHQVTLQPKDIEITSADEAFLNRIMRIIEDNMADETFSVEKLGLEFGMSRSQIHRKLKALTDKSASEIIRNFRLKRGMDLLKNKAGTVSEIAYSVGFNSPVYFTKCFHQYFGYPPGQVNKVEEGKSNS